MSRGGTTTLGLALLATGVVLFFTPLPLGLPLITAALLVLVRHPAVLRDVLRRMRRIAPRTTLGLLKRTRPLRQLFESTRR